MYLPSASTQRPSLTILAIHQVNTVLGGLHSSMLSRSIVQVCRHKTMKKIGPSRRDQNNHRRNFLSLHRNCYYRSRHNIQPRSSRHISHSCLSSLRSDANEDERRRDETKRHRFRPRAQSGISRNRSRAVAVEVGRHQPPGSRSMPRHHEANRLRPSTLQEEKGGYRMSARMGSVRRFALRRRRRRKMRRARTRPKLPRPQHRWKHHIRC